MSEVGFGQSAAFYPTKTSGVFWRPRFWKRRIFKYQMKILLSVDELSKDRPDTRAFWRQIT
jgi:hypothetical protein